MSTADWHSGSGTAPAPQPIHYSKLGRSTGLTVSGVVAIIAAGACAAIGNQASLTAATSLYASSDASTGWYGAGAVLGLIGLLTLTLGISQLTTNVDLAAQYAAQMMQREALAQHDAAEAERQSGRSAISSAGRADEPSAVTGETRRARREQAE